MQVTCTGTCHLDDPSGSPIPMSCHSVTLLYCALKMRKCLSPNVRPSKQNRRTAPYGDLARARARCRELCLPLRLPQSHRAGQGQRLSLRSQCTGGVCMEQALAPSGTQPTIMDWHVSSCGCSGVTETAGIYPHGSRGQQLRIAVPAGVVFSGDSQKKSFAPVLAPGLPDLGQCH